MQVSQGNKLSTLRSVQNFITDNADKLGTIPQSGAVKKLDEAVGILTAHANEQNSSQRSKTDASATHQTTRQTLLRKHMAPIARTAKVELPNTRVTQPLRMPKTKPTTEQLAAAANGMAEAAAPYAAQFIAAGLPLDFIAQLKDATQAMLNSVATQKDKVGQAVAATSGLVRSLPTARRIVQQLDAFVRNALEEDTTLLDKWNQLKRVPQIGGRRATADPVTPANPVVASIEPTTPVATPNSGAAA